MGEERVTIILQLHAIFCALLSLSLCPFGPNYSKLNYSSKMKLSTKNKKTALIDNSETERIIYHKP